MAGAQVSCDGSFDGDDDEDGDDYDYADSYDDDDDCDNDDCIVTDSTYLHASSLPPRCRKTLNEAMPKSEFEMMRMQEDDVRLRNIANKM